MQISIQRHYAAFPCHENDDADARLLWLWVLRCVTVPRWENGESFTTAATGIGRSYERVCVSETRWWRYATQERKTSCGRDITEAERKSNFLDEL
ncbi:hypothetical protein E2542_SST21219 [Spatholobus suberectus]|nr:hypothetical protein E2542_SST21219 [Spatholobus suberectus]